MRGLIRINKLYDAKAYEPIDFAPWLRSIDDLLGSITVGDAPEVIETYTVDGEVVNLVLAGGTQGVTYRIPVTCVSSAKGMTKTVVVQVSIPGVNSNTSPTSAGSAIGNIDGGGPGSTYDAGDTIDGGGP